MKQSAIVLAALFATADAKVEDAKARLQRDIHGWLHNGIAFDKKVIRAGVADHRRVGAAWVDFKDEARENWARGHEVMDDYVAAMKYEKSQETYTAPSAKNGEWGSIHYDHPQQIMDKYVAAYEADVKLHEEWAEDAEQFGERVHKSHEILERQVGKAWDTNGEKAVAYHDAVVGDIQAMSKAKSLAASHAEVREDAQNFFEAVGEAGAAVRQTMRTAERADRKPDRQIDAASMRLLRAREKIAAGWDKAIEYEIANTHFEAGKPGGEGKLFWSNQQQIVDHYAAPIEANAKATARWEASVRRAQAEKQKIQAAAQAEAKKVWPAKFAAVEKSWGELAANFQQKPQSLASRAQIKASLTDLGNATADVNDVVIDDFETFANDTIAQRKAFGADVKKYIAEKKAINQQYAEAYNYEMSNIHFTQSKDGKWNFVVDNRATIIDKWTDAETNDIMAREQLKEDWVAYQKSIAAQKAAFKATAQAQWPKAFEAYQDALVKFDATMGGPQERAAIKAKMAAAKPQSLITDAQQHAAEDIRAQIYDNINDRYELKYEVRQDLKAYLEDTAGARAQLKKEAADWKVASKRVQDMYAAAWNYQIAQTKFTPASAKGPAHIDLQHPDLVSDRYRAAAQADQDLGRDIKGDIMRYGKAIAPAKAKLGDEIKTQWVPQVEKLQHSDVAIFEEVVNFPRTHAKMDTAAVKRHAAKVKAAIAQHKPDFHAPFHHSLMSVDSSSLSTNEQIAYGSVFLMAMIAIAALSNKGKAESKSVEFDVEDLEMTNKKESKKQIKKTLKDIMKTSNTKVTLMNN